MWRVGLMGESSTARNVLSLLSALEPLLPQAGFEVAGGEGVAAERPRGVDLGRSVGAQCRPNSAARAPQGSHARESWRTSWRTVRSLKKLASRQHQRQFFLLSGFRFFKRIGNPRKPAPVVLSGFWPKTRVFTQKKSGSSFVKRIQFFCKRIWDPRI